MKGSGPTNKIFLSLKSHLQTHTCRKTKICILTQILTIFNSNFYYVRANSVIISSITSAVFIKHFNAIFFRIYELSLKWSYTPFCKILKNFVDYFLSYANLKISIGQGFCSTEVIFVKFELDLL